MRSSMFTSMTNFKMDHNTQDRQMNKVATCNIAVAIAVSWASVGGVCNIHVDISLSIFLMFYQMEESYCLIQYTEFTDYYSRKVIIFDYKTE